MRKAARGCCIQGAKPHIPLSLLQKAEELLAARDLRAAVHCFDQAEAAGADPDRCAGGRWWCLMLEGAYERAWQESDAIRARGAHDPHRVWGGKPVRPSDRLLVRSVHGYGDALQMLRFAPRLRARSVTVQCAPRLCELLRHLPGVDEVVPWGEEPLRDQEMEVTELPYAVRATLENVGSSVPYLQVPALPLAPGPQRVGCVWTGGEWNPSRSLPFAQLAPVLQAAQDAGVEVWSLQSEANNDEWRAWCASQGRRCLAAGESSVVELARAVAAMDLVLTVDTFAAHLAGAMGKPCWVLLEREADWRWMVDRADSPWYPSLRLWRQEQGGAWGPVVERVACALRAWAA